MVVYLFSYEHNYFSILGYSTTLFGLIIVASQKIIAYFHQQYRVVLR